MFLADVVDTSRRVAATSKRLEKTDLLANLIKRLSPEEVEIAVAYLSGATPQGRIGIGYAMLRGVLSSSAEHPTLQLLDVHRTLNQFAAVKGSESEQRKREILTRLFESATKDEQQFLVGLLGGELRQGALEGIMLDAIAKATGISSEKVRRAAMLVSCPG